MTRLERLFSEQGQSPWLDNLKRGYLTSGELTRFIDEGIRGITSNPTIFQKAILGQAAYDDQFRSLMERHESVDDSYWDLVIDDVEHALGLLRPLYDESGGGDGVVSLQVAPGLANDTEGTIASARALPQRIDKPNLLVKIPATAAGVPAIEQMIGEGRSINITLIFSIDRYADVIEAYLSGLECCDGDLSRIHSVASSSSAGWTPRSPGAWPRSLPTRPWPCRARRPLPRPSRPMSCSPPGSAASGGKPWPTVAPGCSARCGRRPRPRTRRTRTACTSTT